MCFILLYKVFQIGVYSFEEIIGYQIDAKKKMSKNAIDRK